VYIRGFGHVLVFAVAIGMPGDALAEGFCGKLLPVPATATNKSRATCVRSPSGAGLIVPAVLRISRSCEAASAARGARRVL